MRNSRFPYCGSCTHGFGWLSHLLFHTALSSQSYCTLPSPISLLPVSYHMHSITLSASLPRSLPTMSPFLAFFSLYPHSLQHTYKYIYVTIGIQHLPMRENTRHLLFWAWITQLIQFRFLLWLKNIPLCTCTTISSSCWFHFLPTWRVSINMDVQASWWWR